MALARLVAPRFAHTLFASLRHTDAHGRTFHRSFAAQIDVERRSPCFSHARAFASMDQIAKNGVEDPAIHQRTILFVRETSVSPPKSRHHSPSLSITRSIHRESTFFVPESVQVLSRNAASTHISSEAIPKIKRCRTNQSDTACVIWSNAIEMEQSNQRTTTFAVVPFE